MLLDTVFRYIDLWAKNKEFYSKIGTVVSVDEDAKTIEFKPIDGSNIEDVRLQASIESDGGILLIPEEDSKVIVTFIDDVRCFVSKCTQISKIVVETSDEINITGAEKINIESESDINIKSSGTVDINDGNLTIE